VTLDVTVTPRRDEPTQLTRHRLVAALIATLLDRDVVAFDVRAARLDDVRDNVCQVCGGDCPTRTPRGDVCVAIAASSPGSSG